MTNNLIWIVSVVFVGLYIFYMLINIIRRNSMKEKEWEERLQSVSGKNTSRQRIDKKSAHSLIRKRDHVIARRKGRLSSKLVRITSLRHWLMYTGYNIRPWMLYALGTGITLFLTAGAMIFMKFHILTASFGSIILASLICYGLVRYLVGRQKTLFMQAFPDALDLIRRALRAGYTADRSIVMASEESPEPVKSAFQNIINRLSIGQSLEEALGEVANEVGIDEFHMLAIVLVLQRDTGGSLADVVENFSKIMRERLQLKKKVKAITAEGKASGYFVSAVPFGIIALLMIISPDYLTPLFDTEQGRNFLMIGAGLMAIGIFIIYRMVNKDFY